VYKLLYFRTLLFTVMMADQNTTELPPSKNSLCSHTQQTEQNKKQPQQIHITKITSGNNKRKKPALQRAAES
jgi:hypothetical protein